MFNKGIFCSPEFVTFYIKKKRLQEMLKTNNLRLENVRLQFSFEKAFINDFSNNLACNGLCRIRQKIGGGNCSIWNKFYIKDVY
jgi:hypothetical protein